MKRNPPTIKDNPPTKVFVFILATLLSPWIALGLYTFRSDVKATFDQIPRRVEVHFNKQNRQIELDILELVNKTLELIERREAAIPDRITLMKTRQPKNVFKDPFLVGDTSEVKAIHHVSLNLEYWCKGPVSRSTSTVHDYKDKLIWIIFDCDLPIYDLWIELCINFVKNVVFGLFYTGLWFSVGVCMHLLEMRINKRNNVIRVESYDEKLPPIAVEDNQDDQKQLIKTSSDTAEPTAIQYDQKASSDNTLTASHQQKASGTSKCQNHATQVEVPSSPVLIRFDRGISSSQEYDSDSSCNDHSLMEKLEQASNHVGTGTVPNTDALPANQIGCAVKVKASGENLNVLMKSYKRSQQLLEARRASLRDVAPFSFSIPPSSASSLTKS